MLTDTHCHLDFPRFDPDRPAVLERAAQVGVERILIPGLSLDSSQSVLQLAENDSRLYAAVGIHPTESKTFQDNTLAHLRALAAHPKVVALGEIGLDYYWDAAPHDWQQRVLQAQLHLAAELNLPVILHLREKEDALDGPCAADLLRLLWDWVATLRAQKHPLAERPGVLHSFSGSLQTAQEAISLGFFIGVSGPVTYRKDRQDIVAALPLQHLLLETDAPFLAPAPYRGKRNEPANVRLIADKIAVLHQTSLETVATTTSANARRLFHWKD